MKADDCRPNKALRQTVKIFLKKKLIDRENARKKEQQQKQQQLEEQQKEEQRKQLEELQKQNGDQEAAETRQEPEQETIPARAESPKVCVTIRIRIKLISSPARLHMI